MDRVWRTFALVGELTVFGLKALRDAFRPPFELEYFLEQVKELGWHSLSLILASGFALGVVMSLHTRSTLVQFGAEASIPNFQSMSFFNEIGPLVAALLVAYQHHVRACCSACSVVPFSLSTAGKAQHSVHGSTSPAASDTI